MEKKYYFTSLGLQRAKDEMVEVEDIHLPAIIKEVSESRAQGDLRENAEYHAAKQRQGELMSRLRYLNTIIANAVVIDDNIINPDVIYFNATVKVEDCNTEKQMTFKITGEYESDISRGLISSDSPIGSALLGKSKGDIVEINSPRGTLEYQIIEIQY